ncbi:MAG: type II toxin-antitoxin system RelE/ParE family toxin [Planctomycetota bacterium]|nr:type II toxin-antitoxin system RelE/ParE family toxin [Planctomycetota bacterium]
MRLRWLKRGLQSLRIIHAHIASDNLAAAKYVVQGIRDATRRLSEFPSSGRPGKVTGTRELVLPQWPYIVVYRVMADEVQILRAFHAASDWWNVPTEISNDTDESGDSDE